ncbi:MAG: malonyl-CoA decarboxylase [Pseudomonadota bacterium]
MTTLSELLTPLFERGYRASNRSEWQNRTVAALVDELMGTLGEVSGMALAHELLDRFATMTREEKLGFFRCASRMDIDPDTVRKRLEVYAAAPTCNGYRDFMAAVEPPRQELVRRLNQVPGATGKLVEMRRDLLDAMRQHPELAPFDLDFGHLFASWFNRGFLVLRRINWTSPADLLDKIIAYEAVHAIQSWDDLRRRLQPSDRRCFAFFHPSMPNEPLIFVEVALTKGVPTSVQALLADSRPCLTAQEADTAVFYSISNCQAGLKGVSFGNSLIKQVVLDMSAELKNLKTFVTLSPIPGLAGWLREIAPGEAADAPETLRQRAAQYLLEIKRDDGLPRDPVARFHLSNGALVHAVHAEADMSENGLRQSRGVMVNYLYDRRRIAQNHEKFVGTGRVAASAEVNGLARAAP